MRIHSHSVEKLGNSQIRLKAYYTDKMRRPASVKVSFEHLAQPNTSEQPVIEGDAKEVMDTLHTLAEIAWELGWRPRGLPGALAAFAQLYKLPPLEG